MVKVGFLLPPRQANKSANEHAIQMYHVVCMKGSAYACELSDGSIRKKVYLTRAYSVHQPEFSLSITMKSYGDGEIWGFEVEMEGRANESKVLLGLDGGATSTVCICTSVPSIDEQLPDPPPVLARAVGGCSNHNSIGVDQVILAIMLLISRDASIPMGLIGSIYIKCIVLLLTL
eukprot:Gb_24440 [translate_table: standard]